jgi:proteic killer suppression protein
LDIPSKKISSEIQDRVFRKLQMLDDSSSEADLRSPPSNHFEKLVGRLNGKFSIRVKKNGD